MPIIHVNVMQMILQVIGQATLIVAVAHLIMKDQTVQLNDVIQALHAILVALAIHLCIRVSVLVTIMEHTVICVVLIFMVPIVTCFVMHNRIAMVMVLAQLLVLVNAIMMIKMVTLLVLRAVIVYLDIMAPLVVPLFLQILHSRQQETKWKDRYKLEQLITRL